MKKLLSVLLIVVLVVCSTNLTAFANCGGKGRADRRQSYEECSVDGCETIVLHQHDNVWYCGRNCDFSAYEICAVRRCSLPGLHEHNGAYYYRAIGESGHGCGKGRIW